MENPLTPAGIEPATYSFVAQHLNHCATAVSPRISKVGISLRGFLGNLDVQYIFVDIMCIEYYPNGMNSAENADKFEALK